jgi:single-strand DNA-binding protein
MTDGVNKVTLLGNVGADPDVRRTQAGAPVVSFTLATGESWRDKATGERKERTEWHRVVIFAEGLAKVAEQYVKKGGRLYVEGELRTRKWTDKDGIERYSTEVVLQGFNCSMKLQGGGAGAGGNRPPPNDGTGYSTERTASRSPAASGGARADLDDEIPF